VQSNLGQSDSVTDTATEVDERISIKSLDEMVAKGGANFSAGQRQLLALARGMLKLKYSSILVLDESTANLGKPDKHVWLDTATYTPPATRLHLEDHKTDEAIQEVLRENLTGVTTLCIAHRLKTVIGFDKILVLDHGHVLEYDTPYNLVQDENSSFRDLCRRSGEEALLLRMAEQAEKNRAI
jgi:ABC-type multidrug transport system fused ATPase/permease subunit